MPNTSFFNKMLPYAQRASTALKMPVSVILGQWAHESAYGTSKLAKATNNLGGIKYSKWSKVATVDTVAFPHMKYASYKSFDDYVTDYIRVMSLSYYDGVRKAGATEGIEDDLRALGDSPYAEDPRYTTKVRGVISSNNLIKYDGQGAVGRVGSVIKTPNDVIQSLDSGMGEYAMVGVLMAAVLILIKD